MLFTYENITQISLTFIGYIIKWEIVVKQWSYTHAINESPLTGGCMK